MDLDALTTWINTTPLPLLAGVAACGMAAAALIGFALREISNRRISDDKKSDGQEGYIVSAVLGLLALLMGFTFALAVDRFETRRDLVVEEANAIGTTYLRVQLLSPPHRERMSRLLIGYVDNKIALAKAQPGQSADLLAVNDRDLTDLWAATTAAFDDLKGVPFTNALLDTVNHTIDMDSSRKAARMAHVPSEVFVILLIYLFVTAAVLGYVLTGLRGRISAGFLMLLLIMALMLIIDIDRPTLGGIRESQGPMEALRVSMTSPPTSTYDRWRTVAP